MRGPWKAEKAIFLKKELQPEEWEDVKFTKGSSWWQLTSLLQNETVDVSFSEILDSVATSFQAFENHFHALG